MSEINVSLIPYINKETGEEETCLKIDDGQFEGTLFTIDQIDIDENNELKTEYTLIYCSIDKTEENLATLDSIVSETAITLLEELQNGNE